MINICNGLNKNGKKCKNRIKNNEYCWIHIKYLKKGKDSKNKNKIDNIPNEIYMIIYEYLDFNNRISFSNVNKRSYIIFKSIIKNSNITLLLDKDIKASHYIRNYLKNQEMDIFINLDYNKSYFKGLEEIDYKITFNKKEIVVYKNHIYENNNKSINFGFETKKLKCIDNEINSISDLLEKFDLNK
jgi:hypothetical protein